MYGLHEYEWGLKCLIPRPEEGPFFLLSRESHVEPLDLFLCSPTEHTGFSPPLLLGPICGLLTSEATEVDCGLAAVGQGRHLEEHESD